MLKFKEMTIKRKFILLYIFYGLLSIVLIFSFYQAFIKNFVNTIEEKVISDDTSKLKIYIQSEYENLLGLTKDWAAWDDARLYMQNKNPSFDIVNITKESLENNKVNLIAYFDLNGQLKGGTELDPKTQKIVPVNTKIWEKYVKHYVSKQEFKNQGLVGITFIDDIPFIVAVFEVLKGDFSGPPAGYLIMGRFISKEKLYFIARLFNLEDLKMEKSTENNEFLYINDYSDRYMAAFSEKDFFGNYGIVIKFEKKKFIWELIKKSALKMTLITTFLFLLFGIVLHYGVIKTITKKLLLMVEKLQKDAKKPEFSHKDEIDYLSLVIENYISQIEQNRKIYESIAEESEAIIVVFYKEGKIIFANSIAKEMLSAEREDLSRLYQLVREIAEINLWQKTKLHEFKLKEDLFVSGWIIPVGEEKKYLLFIAHDITYLVKEKLRLLDKASLDTLTSLYNRGFFERYLNRILKTEDTQKYSLIFIDLDDLKKINDTYGHVIGDMPIKSVADAIKSSIRKDDIAARWGGDEFVVVVKGDTEVAKNLAERIKGNVKSIKINDKEEITPNLSYGITIIEKGEDIDKILKRADELAYKQKSEKK
ncbi:hypothetical protein JCM13991_03330 [Thermodesulfovibrio hydrogeniphilus]